MATLYAKPNLMLWSEPASRQRVRLERCSVVCHEAAAGRWKCDHDPNQRGPFSAAQPSLSDRLAKIEALEKELLRKASELYVRDDSVYRADMFVFGATKRTLAQASAFRSLIEASNFQVAAALVRMQIDTAMRLNGLRLVADRDALCDALLAGTPFNEIKDASSKLMSDAHLRKELEVHHPWIGPIYTETSAFVHLSGRAFYTSVVEMDDAKRTFTFLISDRDPNKPETAYFEAVDGFFEITKVAATLVLGYLKARADAAAAKQWEGTP